MLGCTDPYAENYDLDANVDDGSCSGYPNNGNYSLSFAGDADYVNIDAAEVFDLSDEQELTISAYIKTTANTAVVFQAEQSFGYYIGTHNNGEFALTMYFDGFEDLCISNTQVTDGNWHHVTGTYDGSEMSIYVDGVLENTCGAGVLVSQNQTSPITIGAYRPDQSNYQWDGLVDELSLWNRALTQEEIQANMYSMLITEQEENLVGYWRMEKGFGTTALDLSGNRNHGTINDAAWSEDRMQFVPAVFLSSPAGTHTNESPVPVTANFTMDVTGFGLGDISVGNGSVSSLSGSGGTYTFDLTPYIEGEVWAHIPADVAEDENGNSNLASDTLRLTYDITQPTVTIVSDAAPLTTASPVPFEISFSEPVTDFDESDILVTHGSLTNFSDGTNYSLSFVYLIF